MGDARALVDTAFTIGTTDKRLFGAFVEHLGRCVYGGLYEPGHPTADENGFRGDVLALVRELGPTIMRYPGGNFVSGYDWTDGIGPVAERQARLDLAWHTLEPNTVGIDEFMRWAELAGIDGDRYKFFRAEPHDRDHEQIARHQNIQDRNFVADSEQSHPHRHRDSGADCVQHDRPANRPIGSFFNLVGQYAHCRLAPGSDKPEKQAGRQEQPRLGQRTEGFTDRPPEGQKSDTHT